MSGKRHPIYEISAALRIAVGQALSENIVNVRVEITDIEYANEGCSVRGSFKVIPFFVSREGTFKAILDESLGITQLKISEKEESW